MTEVLFTAVARELQLCSLDMLRGLTMAGLDIVQNLVLGAAWGYLPSYWVHLLMYYMLH